MNSLRTRLFVALLAITALVWAVAAGWVYVRTQRDVERVLDARLVEAARMVSSLAATGAVQGGQVRVPGADDELSHQLSCQIWSLEGRLVARSSGAPQERLSRVTEGFSETLVNGETWRVYTVPRPDVGLQVMVGDNLKVRRNLVRQVIAGLLLPAAAAVFALGALIWLVVERGHAPLRAIAETLRARPTSDLSPLPETRAPDELRPMIEALNSLFGRLQAARARERHLTASAAHELKTPLAGLKTQAQIALASDDPEVRQGALEQIAVSVDRTGRLVGQLLEMARRDAEAASPPSVEWLELDPALAQVAAELRPLAESRNVQLVLQPSGAELEVSPELLRAMLRNLLENALQYAASTVSVRLERAPQSCCLIVEDDGAGVGPEELPRLRERFFRGRGHNAVGSGLGLSIVDLAAVQSGFALELEPGTAAGLRAILEIPPARLR
jgi:two-component system sensor histidine kinase QseC